MLHGLMYKYILTLLYNIVGVYVWPLSNLSHLYIEYIDITATGLATRMWDIDITATGLATRMWDIDITATGQANTHVGHVYFIFITCVMSAHSSVFPCLQM